MSTRLIQVVAFANVAASATVALPHQININGTQKTPDFVAADTAGFTIAVTPTQVSVTNTGDAPANVNVWLELKHSIPRELGALANLAPQPFVVASGGSGGGGGGVVHDESMSGAGTLGDPLTTNPWAVDPSPLVTFTGFQKPTVMSRLFNDCFAGITGATSGGGATSLKVLDSDRAPGAWRLQTVAENTAAAASPCEDNTFAPGTLADYNVETSDLLGFDARVRVESTAQSATEDYRCIIGFTQGMISPLFGGAIGGGGCFITSFSDFGDNNWHVRMRDGNGTVYDANTGVPVDAGTVTNHRYTIVWSKSDETWRYYIDGTLVATVATPGWVGGQCGPTVGIADIATPGGPLQRTVIIDWFDVVVVMPR